VKKVFILCLVAVFAAVPFVVGAEEKAKKEEMKEQTIEGEFIDLQCYVGMNAHGKDHKDCAQKCAKAGVPFGLLTKDGKVYSILVPPAKLADHAQKTIRVTGKVAHGNMIMPSKLEAKEGDKWVEVKLPSMM
jgi:hypothetical protein